MIYPSVRQTSAAVAAHYDELDPMYREIWGEHVHHGLWADGRETPAAAAAALSDLVGARLGLLAGQAVIDIGCGYGATARRFERLHGVVVTGVTVSAVQARQAAMAAGRAGQVRQLDWLANDLAAASFDRAYAIESSEHMEDKQRFFDEAWRTLRPGGRLVVCAWLACDAPLRWHIRHLLEPICREGRLPGLGDEAEYREMAERAGFVVVSAEEFGRQVARTWSICARRVMWRMMTDRRYAGFMLDARARNRVFLATVFRMIAAFRSGALRYGVLVFEKAG
ncbi:MAG: methyltransferase domain-containing protein [Acetobacteraceae bacterium]